ncbi:MAG TPA: hypothetical protein VNC61_02845 [Acidimicrobiales bacterium]|nr:hypothetical protein [Acidimicrobiales bacterium]
MSMYSQLLTVALEGQTDLKEEVAAGAAMIRLIRCRQQLRSATQVGDEDEEAVTQARNYFAYDVALIELCRVVNVACDVDEFEHPEKARVRLEGVLAARGVLLVGVDPPEPGQQTEMTRPSIAPR